MGEPTPVSSGPGAARRGGSAGVRGRAGAASFREEAGIDWGGGRPQRPGACSIGMRQALSEVLECAAPGAGLGGRGVDITHSPRGRRGLTKRRRPWEGDGKARMG